MTDHFLLFCGLSLYALLWAGTLGAFRPLSMERSGIYLLVTGLAAGLVYGAHPLFAAHQLVLLSLGKMLAESAYLALVLFLRSVRMPLSRRTEVVGSCAVLVLSLLHLTLNITLQGAWHFWVMALQLLALYVWLTLEAYWLWRAKPGGMTMMLLILMCLHTTAEWIARGFMAYALMGGAGAGGPEWTQILNAWIYITFSFGYVVLTATASVLIDAFRADKLQLERVVQQVEGRLKEKESALLSMLVANAERDNDPGVASLAHELKQPLTVIQLNAEYLASGKRLQPQEAEQILQAILRENQRAAAIVQSVRSLFASKAAQQHQQRLSLSAWLTEWVQQRAPVLRDRQGVQLLLEVHADGVVQVDAAQIEIVLRNLVDNAAEALSGQSQGWIRITLGVEHPMAIVDVVDNGPGVSHDRLEKVFAMNYSTKPEGMGFGLWLSRHISQTHGGHLVALDSTHGAHMRLSLPLATSNGTTPT